MSAQPGTRRPPTAAQFDWGVPGVTLSPPPSHNEIPLELPALADINFDPVGMYNLRRLLGVRMAGFNRQRHRFLASDVAWVAARASEDSAHIPPNDVFFQEFHDLYNSLPPGRVGQTTRRNWGDRVQRLIFDLVRHSLLPVHHD
jgi:hypothetical protein